MSIIARNKRDLKQLFHIDNGDSNNGQQVLSLRLGKKHISFAVCDKHGSALYQLAYCTVESLNESELTAFFDTFPVIQSSFYEVKVVYDLPQSVLIPSKDHKQENAGLLLSTISGNSGNTNAVSELIAEWQLYNIYSVPAEVHEWASKKFPAAKYWHQYSIGIKNIKAADIGGSLTVDFRNDEFTVMAVKEGKLLLAQTFDYSTPEDVLYYLLKTCQQFSLSQQTVRLQLSGLVDKQSSLYKELYQYFIHIEFREPGWNVRSDYPVHYFTSLNDLARCVS